jgi:hypothetical protein
MESYFASIESSICLGIVIRESILKEKCKIIEFFNDKGAKILVSVFI